MKNTLTQPYNLDGMQGKNEQRSEMYIKYFERAAQFLTQHSAKNQRSLLSYAQKQSVVFGELDG